MVIKILRCHGDLNIALVVGICRFFVGDGFIRPEVCTFVNSGQVTSIKQAVRCCLSGFLRNRSESPNHQCNKRKNQHL
ncbi:MAG: hypothetical protein FWG87_04330 [Defluviitaleaceae bacterium]|nr:hypothetical protein [Defluviitaleaceae bacterium]